MSHNELSKLIKGVGAANPNNAKLEEVKGRFSSCAEEATDNKQLALSSTQ